MGRIVGALCLWWFASSGARAVDLGGNDVPTGTVASQDRLVEDGIGRKFGAAAVSERTYSKPHGIPIGNFVFYPSLGTLVRYDDNIFGTSRDRTSDVVTQVLPELRIQSDFSRHEFALSLSGKLVSYAQNEDQNYADLKASASGSLHIDHAHTLSATLLSSLQHEEALDQGRPLAAGRPIEFLHNRASVGITRDAGLLYGTLSATAASWDYQDTQTRDGERIDQDHRDFEILKGQLSAGYRFSPGFGLRAKTAATRTWNRGTSELDYTSMSYEALLGLRGEFNPVLRWEVLGGLGVRDFDRPELASITTNLFEAQLTWLVTQRLTLHAVAARTLPETIDSEGGGRVVTRVGGQADFELWHNLLLKIDAAAWETTSQGDGQSDRTFSSGIGLEYHYSENWLFTFAYEYRQRQSSLSDDEITRNRISIGAKLRF